MNASNSSDNFYFALVAFLLQAKQQVVAISSEFDLTSVQALTLLMIDSMEAPSMSSFCKLYECDAGNITGIIDGLEQKGLVSRRPHPTDRRIKTIHLEAAGKTMQTNIIRGLAATSDHLFTGLNQTELTQFMTLMQKLNAVKK